MNRMDRADALDFDDNQLLDDQIDAVSELDLFSVEDHRKTDLAGDLKSPFPKLMRETSLVGVLK